MNLELPDALLDQLADRVGERIVERLERTELAGAGSPWRTMEEAAEYTRIPLGTFKKLAAEGTIRSHSHSDRGRRKVFHVAELDRALGYAPAGDDQVTPLRRVG